MFSSRPPDLVPALVLLAVAGSVSIIFAEVDISHLRYFQKIRYASQMPAQCDG